jgi:hypothetical protein
MWKVLGVEAVIPRMANVFEERVIELSKRKRDRPRFLDMMAAAEVSYMFDPMREISVFRFDLPSKYSPEDIEFLKGFVLRVLKSAQMPVIEFDGAPQEYAIILNAEKEEDDYDFRRKHRSDIFGVMESAAVNKKEREERSP